MRTIKLSKSQDALLNNFATILSAENGTSDYHLPIFRKVDERKFQIVERKLVPDHGASNNVKVISNMHRRSGTSTWILKAALQNPKCLIIFKDEEKARKFKYDYYRELSKLNPWRKFWVKLKIRKVGYPIFQSISVPFISHGYPIIFDNSALV